MKITDFEARMRIAASRYDHDDAFTDAIGRDAFNEIKYGLGEIPCSFWARVRAEALPTACRLAWMRRPESGSGPWTCTADRCEAIGVAYATNQHIAGRPSESVPFLICETHAAKAPADWRVIRFTSAPMEIDAGFPAEMDRKIIRAVCAAEGRLAFAKLAELGAELPDPRVFTWRVRSLADAGWLLAKVVPFGTGDATIEGDVVVSPAFVQIFCGLRPYWTIKIPWALPEKRTEWHPTESDGPFAVLSSGAFDTLPEAAAWATANLNGTACTIEHVPLPTF